MDKSLPSTLGYFTIGQFSDFVAEHATEEFRQKILAKIDALRPKFFVSKKEIGLELNDMLMSNFLRTYNILCQEDPDYVEIKNKLAALTKILSQEQKKRKLAKGYSVSYLNDEILGYDNNKK